ncbi:MAG: c-type cytochrome [Gemmatimonadota bacterium]
MRSVRVLVMMSALACALFGQALAADEGAAVYGKCAGCHKATGEGVPGFFPPLAGHAADLAKADRTYLVRVLLFGLKGEIRVAGKTYDGTMPAYRDLLDDGQTAAVLNYVLASWGNAKALPQGFAKISADEVKVHRAENLTPGQVYEARGKLKLK